MTEEPQKTCIGTACIENGRFVVVVNRATCDPEMMKALALGPAPTVRLRDGGA